MSDKAFKVQFALKSRSAVLFVILFGCAVLGGAGTPSYAQQAVNQIGGFNHDSNEPVEIASDSLEVRQADSKAIFIGNVDARQGGARLQAERVEVTYETGGDASGTGALKYLRAVGEVYISSEENVAKGDWADYDLRAGIITMGDNVLLSQGPGSAIQGKDLRIDLNTGLATMVGGRNGVNVIFTPSSSNP